MAESFTLEHLLDTMGTKSRSQVESFNTALKRKQITGAHACAKATVEILRVVLGIAKLQTAEQMLGAVRTIGKELSKSAPSELAVGNITRRVMYIIREEYSNKLRGLSGAKAEVEQNAKDENVRDKKKRSGSRAGDDLAASGTKSEKNVSELSLAKGSPRSRGRRSNGERGEADVGGRTMHQPSLSSVIGAWETELEPGATAEGFGLSQHFPDMRQAVMGAVNELNDEIENIYGPICEQAQEHIHAEQCILAYGWSHVVELFLKAAAKRRKFQVVIAEASPELSGFKLAAALSAVPNITVTLIPDSAIYAIMSRVNKVIVSPHAVLNDGGAMFTAGHTMTAVVAREYNVPVVGLAAVFHLTPMSEQSYEFDQSKTFGQLLSPALAMAYNEPVYQDNVEVIIPAFDFVSPDLIGLYITNNGSHQPSYIHRLLAEVYHPSDYASLL